MGRAEHIDAMDLLPDSEEGALASSINHDGSGSYFAKTADGWKEISQEEHRRRTLVKYTGAGVFK